MRRKLAMKDDYWSFMVFVPWCVNKMSFYVVNVGHVGSALDVASFVFVRKPTINNIIRIHNIAKLSFHELHKLNNR